MKANATKVSAPAHSLVSLVQGTVVEGTVEAESDIRIDGRIKGKLICKAKVIVGPSGHIEGEIICQNAVVEGHINGKVEVRELLNVRETARIEGKVQTDKLIVQSGALFNVECHMGKEEAEAVLQSANPDKEEKAASAENHSNTERRIGKGRFASN